MMQNLLEERFQLKAHREKREVPIYELQIAKSGLKLEEVSEPAPRAAAGSKGGTRTASRSCRAEMG